ncbi:hypothetical protein P389DRAFT_198946 [Cystobasidium minutum MCA 4210]|uniref:uncharacterized protein n=1 Tax=Cystobasidium minutum MCA 4210 TaxID=1397322 RepID=UPI0034CE8D16|eukprot:jgi/Rhomi1/198946/gm1.7160_g
MLGHGPMNRPLEVKASEALIDRPSKSTPYFHERRRAPEPQHHGQYQQTQSQPSQQHPADQSQQVHQGGDQVPQIGRGPQVAAQQPVQGTPRHSLQDPYNRADHSPSPSLNRNVRASRRKRLWTSVWCINQIFGRKSHR